MKQPYSLDDKYRLETGRVYITGTQALARLPMLQHQRDIQKGHNTAGFISGYRGSPLGGFDKALWQAKPFLQDNHIHFQPGVNEDLAATAVWGTQQVTSFPGAQYDGVFGMWYGKGPGVDRCGDVFKHANAAGTSPLGGVLAIAGDDHNCKSSTLPHQSEFAFIDAMMPILNPSSVQDILDMGIMGWALSRFSGCWVGFKTVAETIDSSISAMIDPNHVDIKHPDKFEMPTSGLHLRWPDKSLDQESRLHHHKLAAAQAFVRVNAIDKTVLDCEQPRIGIITTGKAYMDVLQALEDLQIDDNLAKSIGLSIYKVGMSWPLENSGVLAFAKGLEEVIIVEEKRGVLEPQVKDALYHLSDRERPIIVGKQDETGRLLFPSTGELAATTVAKILATRFERFCTTEHIKNRLQFITDKEAAQATSQTALVRTPYFCSGCPHNTSTKIPEGSRAMAGIGCHFMVTWMDRRTETFTQMGGEGATWIGQAPFTDTKHIFQNLGDGTYFHSGILAIRAAVSANINITYKILYNDAVAMTGGQPLDGELTVSQLAQQVRSEGVEKIVVVSDDPKKFNGVSAFPAGITFHHRDELDQVQKILRKQQGVSVLIYDQICATEKRRRIKRGEIKPPAKRVFINPAVCEGCGDCSEQSNCLSIIPIETQKGRKRAIDQSSCNTDFSCVKGFCPSFVTIHGGHLQQPALDQTSAPIDKLPQPTRPDTDKPYNILVTGIGGTGIVTIGALIGIAAHLENKGCSVLDMTGLAQKFGSVISHLRIANSQDKLHGTRVGIAAADLLIGCDLIVAASDAALTSLGTKTQGVVNNHISMPPEFIHQPDLQFPVASMEQSVIDVTSEEHTNFVDATTIATKLLGDSVYANLLMVGFAYQKGQLPVSAHSLETAIDLNGVAAEKNKQAFRWGRLAAHDLSVVLSLMNPAEIASPSEKTLTETINYFAAELTAYQNKEYAQRYRKLIGVVQHTEEQKTPGKTDLAMAVAKNYAKVLAYKDEYEVARLQTDPIFLAQLDNEFAGSYSLEFNFASPILAKKDPDTGALKKRKFSFGMLTFLKMLARFKWLRGSFIDPFSYSDDRKLEQTIIAEYELLIDSLIISLTPERYVTTLALAELPQMITGFGHIKKNNYEKAKAREIMFLKQFTDPEDSLDNSKK